MKNLVCIITLLFSIVVASAADTAYIRRITDTLSSPAFSGRGYVNNGMQKAGDFIAAEMETIGMSVATQSFKYPAVSFPGLMELSINGNVLQPGKDFIVDGASGSAQAGGELSQTDSVTFIRATDKVIIKLVDKLTWSVATAQENYTVFFVRKDAVYRPARFTCKVEAAYIKSFAAKNIIGVIQGNKKADSLIVITAHYDHLGMMGKETMFAGANDNAGGVALMLSLGKHYAQRASPYTIIFIAFAGEEAGLLGSEHFVRNPVFDLSAVKFLLNLDLMGNGEEGITVVNATEFPKQFALLQEINTEKGLLATVQPRGKAKNSDHYWFTEKGVPSFFIYTLGKRKAYHDVDDIPSTVPWYEASDLETLLTTFIKRLANQ
jgi:aminopeptidase YwaD